MDTLSLALLLLAASACPALALTVGGVQPSVLENTVTNAGTVRLEVLGSGMASGASVSLHRVGQGPIHGTNVAVETVTSLQADFDLQGMPVGSYDVTVTNPGGTNATHPLAFTITQIPVVTGINPSFSAPHGITATITGIGIVPGPVSGRVRLERGSTVIYGAFTNVTPEFVEAEFHELVIAPLGFYDVVLTNPGGLTGRLVGGFELRDLPHVFAPTPNQATDTSAVTLTITGHNIKPGATVKLTRSGEPDIEGTSVVVVQANPPSWASTLYAVFDIVGHAKGLWNVEVTNPDGNTDTGTHGFTLRKFLTTTAVSPATGSDQEVVRVLITGTGFESALVRLEQLSFVPGTVRWVSHLLDSMEVDFDLRHAEAGVYDVRVTTPHNGATRVLPAAFEVLGELQLTSVDPPSAPDTAAVDIAIFGRNILPGAEARLTRSGSEEIVGTSVSVVPGVLAATFDVRDATLGAWDVVVTNQDGTTATIPEGFTIHAGQVASVGGGRSTDVDLVVAPNPTSGEATVMFSLPSESMVRVAVVDVSGREIVELARGTWPAGRHKVGWDGRGRRGQLPTGLYFMRVESGGRVAIERFVRVR